MFLALTCFIFFSVYVFIPNFYIFFQLINHNLMVVYLTDARLTTVTWRERICELVVYNIFLTPVHSRIHNCIQDWIWEWDPALNTSTV